MELVSRKKIKKHGAWWKRGCKEKKSSINVLAI